MEQGITEIKTRLIQAKKQVAGIACLPDERAEELMELVKEYRQDIRPGVCKEVEKENHMLYY